MSVSTTSHSEPHPAAPLHGALALDDIIVIGIEQALAAPLATRHLADLGARVIKIERPVGGDFARGYDSVVEGTSSAFVWLNRGKESVQVDLKTPEGRAALDALLRDADVLVANLSPRVLASMELTAEALAAAHPRLIVCTISGYSPDGPSAERKAYDALIQAEVGLMSQTGTPNQPAKTGISIADIAAGTQAYGGILAALRHRDRTGEALPVRISLFDALTEWMSYPLYYTMHGGSAPVPMGTQHPTIAPYGAVETSDGTRLMLAVQNDREWDALCSRVLEMPELINDPRFNSNAARVAHRSELDALIAAACGNVTEPALVGRLDAARIAWSRLNGLEELATHPELADETRWLTTRVGARDIKTLAPVAVPGGRHRGGGTVPGLGDDTARVLAELSVNRTKEEA